MAVVTPCWLVTSEAGTLLDRLYLQVQFRVATHDRRLQIVDGYQHDRNVTRAASVTGFRCSAVCVTITRNHSRGNFALIFIYSFLLGGQREVVVTRKLEALKGNTARMIEVLRLTFYV